MKDEIKEILDKLRSDDYYEKEYQKSVYYERDLKKLKDYITNLQEKYDKALTDLVHESHTRMELESKITNLQEENRILKGNAIHEEMIYKSRNEKAIKYINTHYLNANEPELLNILNGGDE